jgi:hypothetical protein
MSHRLPSTLLAVLGVAIAIAASLSAQEARAGWTLAYSVSGGIMGQARTVTITAAGRIQLDDRRLGRLDVPMERDLFVRARDAVAAAREVAPARRTPYPDEIVSSLTLTSDGRTRDIEMTPDLLNALRRGADIGVWQALVGTWRQVALTYCTPAAHQSPGDVEPAIETLTFNGDSSFAVHWPGDPHAAGQPRVALPSLRGSFRASLSGGSLELTPDDGIAPPRDFAGNGSFRFDGDRRLLLRGVWLGTRSAATRPDVCEIAFEKE